MGSAAANIPVEGKCPVYKVAFPLLPVRGKCRSKLLPAVQTTSIVAEGLRVEQRMKHLAARLVNGRGP